MDEILDKILLLICSSMLYLVFSQPQYAIVPIIIVVICSSLFLYFDNGRFKLFGVISYVLLCSIVPNYIIFLPLLLYDVVDNYKIVAFFSFLLIAVRWGEYNTLMLAFLLVFYLMAYILRMKTDKIKVMEKEYNELRDDSTSKSLLLEEKNRTLLQNQDYEINIATLNERNRISKEIHDNIGHLLSRTILQIGALLTIAKDEAMKEGLTTLKVALSEGMDQIRHSIHRMYDDSIDLYAQVEQLVKNFTFCHVYFDYDVKSSPTLPVKQSFIAIIKEALANVMRHSNATNVSIYLREHPAMYQLIIEDNGTIVESKKEKLFKVIKKQGYEEGLGLNNIMDRIKGLDGNINISIDKGFQIFITVPKSKT